MADGKLPYEGESNQDLPQKLQFGLRLSRPTGCPSSAYLLMCLCWSEQRPSFAWVVECLSNWIEDPSSIFAHETAEFPMSSMKSSIDPHQQSPSCNTSAYASLQRSTMDSRQTSSRVLSYDDSTSVCSNYVKAAHIIPHSLDLSINAEAFDEFCIPSISKGYVKLPCPSSHDLETGCESTHLVRKSTGASSTLRSLKLKDSIRARSSSLGNQDARTSLSSETSNELQVPRRSGYARLEKRLPSTLNFDVSQNPSPMSVFLNLESSTGNQSSSSLISS